MSIRTVKAKRSQKKTSERLRWIRPATIQAPLFKQSVVDETELAIEFAPLKHNRNRSRFAHLVKRGLRDGEFRIVYQPKIDARTLKPSGAECLIRWERAASLGLSTLDVIKLAESSGCISNITNWVIGEVDATILELERNDFELPLSINISAKLLGQKRFGEGIKHSLSKYAHRVVLEITETAIFGNEEIALTNLNLLIDAGFTFSLDDFGTGYSSLTQLQKLPLQEIKIDKSFISELTTSHQAPLLVRSTIDLAHALECEVVAEGIEDPTTLALLTVMGCDELQGFFIAKPMRREELLSWLCLDEHAYKRAESTAKLVG